MPKICWMPLIEIVVLILIYGFAIDFVETLNLLFIAS